MKRTIGAIVIVTLLLLLNMPHSIEASNRKEISVEIYTPMGIQKITKNISAEVIEKIFLLIDEVNEKNIDKILHELDKYGLLGNFSIEEARELVCANYLQKLQNKRNKFIVNLLCLIGGYGYKTRIVTPLSSILNLPILFFYPAAIWLGRFLKIYTIGLLGYNELTKKANWGPDFPVFIIIGFTGIWINIGLDKGGEAEISCFIGSAIAVFK